MVKETKAASSSQKQYFVEIGDTYAGITIMQAMLKNPLNRDEETYRAVTTAISIVMSSSNFFFFTYRQFCVFSLTDFQTCLFVCLAGSRAANQPVWR